MTTPLNLVAIIGSLRAESANRAVFDAATELIGSAVTLSEIDLSDVPLYNGDLEAHGDPASVAAMKQAVIDADGLIIFTPEYNGSIPAVTKNAIDWLSRMPGDSALTTASVGAVAASPGGRGGAGVRQHLSDSLARITGDYFTTTLGIGGIFDKIENGCLTDVETRKQLTGWLAAFVDHISESTQPDG